LGDDHQCLALQGDETQIQRAKSLFTGSKAEAVEVVGHGTAVA
jgi:hypothetical protein